MKSLAALIVCLLISLDVLATPLTIVTENFPPYNYEENGKAKGLSTEVVQAVLKEAGLQCEIFFYPWARAYKLSQIYKNTLIYSIARIPEREDLFHWVGVIAPYKTSLYKLKSNDHIVVNSLADARQFSVGVSLEDVIFTYLKGKNFRKLNIVSNDLFNIRMLTRGRLDLIAYDEASFLHKIQTEGLNPFLFERVYRLEELTGSLYMAFNRDTDPTLVEKFQVALKTIKKKGIYEKIQKRYLALN